MANPGDFIAIAEDSGLIIPLGDVVLELACAQQARRRAAGSSRDHVAVNVSARQLGSDHFVDGVEKVLAAYDLRPEKVCIEVTESTLIDVASSTRGRLHELKDLGVSLALDDFGTGWSSLSYLRRFPFDVVKIDQSFVAGLGTNHSDTQLVKAVIDLAEGLNLERRRRYRNRPSGPATAPNGLRPGAGVPVRPSRTGPISPKRQLVW